MHKDVGHAKLCVWDAWMGISHASIVPLSGQHYIFNIGFFPKIVLIQHNF